MHSYTPWCLCCDVEEEIGQESMCDYANFISDQPFRGIHRLHRRRLCAGPYIVTGAVKRGSSSYCRFVQLNPQRLRPVSARESWVGVRLL
jgi:hypothetical protein